MDPTPLGLLLIACGVGLFVQGRMWQARAAGPGISVLWGSLPVYVRRIFRPNEGPLMVGPLPAQLWGVTAIVVGALLAIGVIPNGQPAAQALFIVLVPGTIAMGVATLLTRLFASVGDDRLARVEKRRASR
jgi:hypothetical protein